MASVYILNLPYELIHEPCTQCIQSFGPIQRNDSHPKEAHDWNTDVSTFKYKTVIMFYLLSVPARSVLIYS